MDHLTPEFLERQRISLVARMVEVRQQMDPDAFVGIQDLGDPLDRASDATTAACHSSLTNQKLSELASIDAALTRIQRGTYGICEMTGEEISRERLEAFPTARYSIKAQSKLERRTFLPRRSSF